MSADSVTCSSVEDVGASTSCGSDERRGCVGEGEREEAVRAVVGGRVEPEVVDDMLASIGELDLELAGKVAPQLGSVGRCDEDEVGAAVEPTSEGLRSQLDG